ncbi:alanine dehydrogenase [Staphylococcus simiae]|uniref:Alanine dehydrogenase n=1 Tax=Staphylococcus simiae CCM 7213 = CCUG 51256 TaxID=911238 RepID=G5JIF6_9STAP|nr:alanine dehydrogenase [Staphylococcus simiae]EHJ08047.1 alanine dehydrogenase [Staphylococcus simiae CCM 7213 = CCUG 51256]PNZ14567.1 alanine dehydrogenase [Staphylococcus simiae]SNV58114.1 alanine dehydrogenase [Staphylococcus simiae]
MKIGVIKELKPGEGRVACTPENVAKLVAAGNEVYVETDAGIGSGFSNEEYQQAGAHIVSHEDSWKSDLIIKVKEPDEKEFKFFRDGQIIWGFQHLASSKETVEAMQKAGVTAIGGETIVKDGKAVLLAPMSAVAGRRSMIMAAYYLEAQHKGEGILISGIDAIDGIPSGNVVIFGGGSAAVNAATIALGMQAHVTIIELNAQRREWLTQHFNHPNFRVVESNEDTLKEEIKHADAFISTILIPGSKPPKLITRDMVRSMKPGSVIVDISIDQGGTVEGIHPTTIAEPIYIEDDVIHYAVPNQPGAVPRTSTMVLAAGNIEYLLAISKSGIDQAISNDPVLASGVNIYRGHITNEGLAQSHDLPYENLENLVK